jgi:hypothetical protein
MTVPLLLAKEVSDIVRHNRETPKQPRDYSLFKRTLLVLGLLIGLILGANAYLASQGGILGIVFHDIFGGSPSKTVTTTEVPDVARVTQAIRKLGTINGTQHNYPIAFTTKRQSTFLGINDGSSHRSFDGVGVAVAGASLTNAVAEQTGAVVYPIAGKKGTISISITLGTPRVIDKHFADQSPGEKKGFWGPDIPYSQISDTAKGMLDQAIATDATLLGEAQEDVSSALGPIVISALGAGDYEAHVSFIFVDPSVLVPYQDKH